MYTFFRKNNKKMLAVFAAFLMVAFILPNTFQANQGGGQYVIGTIGDDKLYETDLNESKAEWDMLKGRIVLAGQNMPAGMRQPSLLEVFTQSTPAGAYIAGAIDQNPELYLLLQEEAERMGVFVSDAEVNQLFDSGFAVRMDDGSVRPIEDAPKSLAGAARHAVAEFLRVQNAFERASSVLKVSQPRVQHSLAESRQQIKVRVLEVDAKALAKDLPAPTTQQLQQQFEQYADTAAGFVTETNPFGFGYRHPDRVKLQYIAVPRSEVRRAVRALKSQYDWEVEAQRYYLRNPKRFPASQPATQPAVSADQFSLGPTTATKPAPTTAPFAEVREQIIDELIDPQAEQLAKTIIEEIVQALETDYERWMWRQGPATPGQAPATAPATAPAAPYDSFEYLQQLAQRVQQKHGVLPTVVSLADQFRSAEELRQLPFIGDSRSTGEMGRGFAVYATSFLPPTTAPATAPATGDALLSLFEPSEPLRDEANSSYVFRLTDVKPDARPADLSEVADQVKADWTRATAFERAREQAKQVVEAARKAGGVAETDAAKSARVVTTDYFSNQTSEIPGLTLSSDAVFRFADQAFSLLKQAAADAGKQAIGTIELPGQEKLFVAELVSVKPDWPANGEFAFNALAARDLSMMHQQQMLIQWFSLEGVTERIGFNDGQPKKKPGVG